jgi:hypothetical protein
LLSGYRAGLLYGSPGKATMQMFPSAAAGVSARHQGRILYCIKAVDRKSQNIYLPEVPGHSQMAGSLDVFLEGSCVLNR